MDLIEDIIQETAPVFGLPPYWWRFEGRNQAVVSTLAKERWLNHPQSTQAKDWERVHCFATMMGKCSTEFRIERHDVVAHMQVGAGTATKFLAIWEAFPIELRKMYLCLRGEQGNEFRQAEVVPWMSLSMKVSGIFSQTH